MPIYEFHCEKCDKEFSLQMKISELDSAKVSCPRCKSEKNKRIMTAFTTFTSNKS